MEPAKNWWESRMMWLGIATAVLGYLSTTKNADGTPIVPPELLPWITLISGVLTTYLRPQSSGPIKPLS